MEDVVPAAHGYKYVTSRDETTVVPRSEKEREEPYSSTLAQVALRTVHEIFISDVDKVVNGILLNGHVTTVDRATGHEVSPCLVTLSTDREQFGKLRPSQVDPAACLKRLNALVSPNPYDLEPVRPIIEFDLSKYRLMDSMDVVADLDSRPVLVKLTPTGFEHLIRQLFGAIGMEAWSGVIRRAHARGRAHRETAAPDRCSVHGPVPCSGVRATHPLRHFLGHPGGSRAGRLPMPLGVEGQHPPPRPGTAFPGLTRWRRCPRCRNRSPDAAGRPVRRRTGSAPPDRRSRPSRCGRPAPW
jgi:hypothetical protein